GFLRGRRQLRGAGMDRSLAGLARARAGAERTLGQRQDTSGADLGGSAKAPVIDGADLENKSVPDLTALAASTPALMIEHADRAPERGLFHLYNLVRERGGHLLLVSEM